MKQIILRRCNIRPELVSKPFEEINMASINANVREVANSAEEVIFEDEDGRRRDIKNTEKNSGPAAGPTKDLYSLEEIRQMLLFEPFRDWYTQDADPEITIEQVLAQLKLFLKKA